MPPHEESLSPELGRLIEAAKAAASRAYAPYSGFGVGAAVLSEAGTVHLGVNVENASFPAGLCAERAAAAAAVAAGHRDLRAVAVAPAGADVETLLPCGFCLQFLSELGRDLLVVAKERGRWVARPVSALLPAPFSLPGADVGEPPTGTLASVPREASSGPSPPLPVRGALRLERVRHPDPGVLDELARLETEVFGTVGLRAVDLAVAAEAGGVYRAWAAEGGDRQAFVGSCQLLRTLDDPATLYLVGFSIAPRLQGQGWGRPFLDAVLNEAAALGADGLLLTVSPDNAAALALYRGAEFAVQEELPAFYGPEEDRVLLRRTISREAR